MKNNPLWEEYNVYYCLCFIFKVLDFEYSLMETEFMRSWNVKKQEHSALDSFCISYLKQPGPGSNWKQASRQQGPQSKMKTKEEMLFCFASEIKI